MVCDGRGEKRKGDDLGEDPTKRAAAKLGETSSLSPVDGKAALEEASVPSASEEASGRAAALALLMPVPGAHPFEPCAKAPPPKGPHPGLHAFANSSRPLPAPGGLTAVFQPIDMAPHDVALFTRGTRGQASNPALSVEESELRQASLDQAAEDDDMMGQDSQLLD